MKNNLGVDLGLTVNGKRTSTNATLGMYSASTACETPSCGESWTGESLVEHEPVIASPLL